MLDDVGAVVILIFHTHHSKHTIFYQNLSQLKTLKQRAQKRAFWKMLQESNFDLFFFSCLDGISEMKIKKVFLS
jgi:hypothetical protein